MAHKPPADPCSTQDDAVPPGASGKACTRTQVLQQLEYIKAVLDEMWRQHKNCFVPFEMPYYKEGVTRLFKRTISLSNYREVFEEVEALLASSEGSFGNT